MCVLYKYSLGGTPTYRSVVLPISEVVLELNMCFYVSAPPGTYLSVTPLQCDIRKLLTQGALCVCLAGSCCTLSAAKLVPAKCVWFVSSAHTGRLEIRQV